MEATTRAANLFDPARWGLPAEAVSHLGQDLYEYWEGLRPCLRTRTRDTSENGYTYLRAQLTMEDERNFANVDRRLNGGDGQSVQEFMSNSPWSAQAVFRKIQGDIAVRPVLQSGGVLVLDESADAKGGVHSAGAGRQHNGRLGKVDMCQVSTCLIYAHPVAGIWTVVDGELFLPEAWFSCAYADLRKRVGVSEERAFATKPELGLAMIRRVRAQGLPFDVVACDDLYGRNKAFRAALDADQIRYAAEAPANTCVYLQRPRDRSRRVGTQPGRGGSRGKGSAGPQARQVREVAQNPGTQWRRVRVRPCERGGLQADFVVRRVWTRTPKKEVRAEWLVIRRDGDGKLTFVLLNAPSGTSELQLIEQSCQRHLGERNFEDAKSELGWDDFRAQKYRAWEHELALTAAALWFVAQVKLNWRERYARDPELTRQLEVEVLPALSTANVRELLQAVLPLPQLTPEQATDLVVRHLLNRARSTRSRLKSQRDHADSFP